MSPRILGASLLAVAMVCAPVVPVRAASRSLAATTSLEPGSAKVVVDAGEVGTMSSRKVDDVAIKATGAVVEAGVPPEAVRITFVEIDPVKVLRGVRVVITTDEAPVLDPEGDARGQLLASCTACSDAELAGLAIEAVLAALELRDDALEASRAAAAEAKAREAAAEAAAAEPETQPSPSAPEEQARRPLGPLGWSGIVGLGLGAGGVIAGAVLASQRPAPYPGAMRLDELRDVRPPGYAALGIGAALMIAGAVLLSVDRRRARPKGLSVTPWLGPRTFGVAMVLPR